MNIMNIAEKSLLDKHLKKPYNIIIKPVSDEAGNYFAARVLEFDGCITTGETKEEAHNNIYEVLEGFIEDMIEEGEEVPEPIGDEDFSGNLRVRMPKSMHKNLSQAAKLEGISLNQYIIHKLSK